MAERIMAYSISFQSLTISGKHSISDSWLVPEYATLYSRRIELVPLKILGALNELISYFFTVI